MKTPLKLLIAGALVAAVLSATGCAIRREPIPNAGRATTTTETVSLGDANEAHVDVKMGAGKLRIEGGQLGTNLMEGTFEYSPAEFEPIIETETGAGRTDVTIRHRTDLGINLGRDIRNRWDIVLAEGVPTILGVDLGAGDSQLELADLDLSELTVDVGAGDKTIALGAPQRDLRAKLTSGAGDVTVRLPRDVGVRVSGRRDGVGDWRFDGFREEGDYLVNDAYGTAETSIELDVQRGVGRVTLELVD